MPTVFLAFILLAILSVQTASASEKFRIERPEETGLVEPGKNFGNIVFAGMRTPMPGTTFERWRQSYCAPFICNMVLCHGTCAVYEDHCPSFAESGRVINLDASNCLVPGGSASMPQVYSGSLESSKVTAKTGCCR